MFPNPVANDYKSHVVVNGVVTFWLISTSVSYIPLAILDIEGEMEQELIYVGLPNKCLRCKSFDHQVKACLIVQKIKLGHPMPPFNLTLTNLQML